LNYSGKNNEKNLREFVHLVCQMCLWDSFYFISWKERGIKHLPVKHTLHSKRKHIPSSSPHAEWAIYLNADQLKQNQMHFIAVNMQNNQSLWKMTLLGVWHKHRKYPFVK